MSENLTDAAPPSVPGLPVTPRPKLLTNGVSFDEPTIKFDLCDDNENDNDDETRPNEDIDDENYISSEEEGLTVKIERARRVSLQLREEARERRRTSSGREISTDVIPKEVLGKRGSWQADSGSDLIKLNGSMTRSSSNNSNRSGDKSPSNSPSKSREMIHDDQFLCDRRPESREKELAAMGSDLSHKAN